MKHRNKIITCIPPQYFHGDLIFGKITSGIEPIHQKEYIRRLSNEKTKTKG